MGCILSAHCTLFSYLNRLGISSYIAEDVFGFQEELGRNLLAFYMCQLTGKVVVYGEEPNLIYSMNGQSQSITYVMLQNSRILVCHVLRRDEAALVLY